MSSSLDEPVSGFQLNFWKSQWKSQRTPLDIARLIPNKGLYYAVKKIVEDDLEGFPEEHIDKYSNYAYICMAHAEKSDNEKAITA